MKWPGVLSLAGLGIAAAALIQAPAPRSLSVYIPAGPLLTLEAQDFSSLLRDWNGSEEKKRWLDSANYQVFSRSKLYQRLSSAQDEFAAAAGLPPDMALLDSVAGAESVLALYDIGKLEFLYITRLASARAMESLLWKARGSYETREAAGTAFFVKVDAESQRVAAFAVVDDYLLAATREDLIPQAFKLIKGAGGDPVTSEEWFSAPAREAKTPGELRLTMNLTALTRSPHFRSYWIQRNVSDLRQFGAGIVDLFRSPGEIREERTLLRFGEAPPAVSGDALRQVLRLAPDDAGFYRAWANPSADDAFRLLLTRVIDPTASLGRVSEAAPAAAVAVNAGSENDLETRIDETPAPRLALGFAPEALKRLLSAAPLEAMLEAGSSRALPESALVRHEMAVALLAASEWKPEEVRTALSTAAESGPLGRLVFEARGRMLIVTNSAALLKTMTTRLGAAPAQAGARYAGAFRPGRELPHFERVTQLIDYAASPQDFARGTNREPRFFSDNIASLGRTLSRVESSSIVVRDAGRSVTQTVVYRFGQ